MKVFKCVSVLLLFFCCQLSFAQLDKEFWFGIPEVSETHGDTAIFLRIATASKPSNVTIEFGLSGPNPITAFIPANSDTSINLTSFKNQLEPSYSSSQDNAAIHITSTELINVYYDVDRPNNSEIFVLKGSVAEGKNFIVPNQTRFENYLHDNDPHKDSWNSLIVTATEENVGVTITPSVILEGYENKPVGQPFTILYSMSKGNSLYLRAKDKTKSPGLAGTKIQANKNVVVTSYDDGISVDECQDLIGDQIVPNEGLGDNFVVVKGDLDAPISNESDYLYFTSPTVATVTIKTNSSENNVTVNSGETVEYILEEEVAYITSSNPIHVYHITGTNCEAGSALLPQYECAGSVSVSFNNSSNNSFVTLITDVSGIDGFVSDITINSGDFSPIFAGSDIYFAKIDDVSTEGFINVRNTKSNFQLGYVSLEGGGSRYGFFSNYSTEVDAKEDVGICKGQTATLEDPIDFYNYQYVPISGDMTVIPQNTNEVSPNVTTTYSLTKLGGCPNTDEVTVFVSDLEVVKPNLSFSNCDEIPLNINLGDDLSVTNGFPSYTYSWVENGNVFSTASNPQITIDQYGANILVKTITVTVTDKYGCSNSETFTITVYPKFEIEGNYDPNARMCENETKSLTLPSFQGGKAPLSYLWSSNTGKITSSNKNVSNPSITDVNSDAGGEYFFTITDANGCVVSDKIILEVVTGPSLNVGGDMGPVCENGKLSSIVVTSTPNRPRTMYKVLYPIATQFQISNNFTEIGPFAINDKLIVEGQTTYLDPNITCVSTKTIDIEVTERPNLTVTPVTICKGETATLFAEVSAVGGTFEWSDQNGVFSNDQSVNVSPAQTTTYNVKYTLKGCEVEQAIAVTVLNSIDVIVSSNKSICRGQSTALNVISTSESGGTYNWSGSDGSTYASPDITVTPTSTTTYTLTYTVTNGSSQCSGSSTVTVTVNPLPTFDVSAHPSSICKGENSLLTASNINPSNGTFIWTGNGNSFTDNPVSVNPTQLGNNIYNLEYVDNNGCSNSESLIVFVNEKPIVSIVPNEASGCPSDNVILKSIGSPDGGSYLWSTGETSQEISVSNSNGTYNYFVEYNLNNCGVGANAKVVISEISNNIIGNQGFCEVLNSLGEVIISGSTPKGGNKYKYQWERCFPALGTCSWTEIAGATDKDLSVIPTIGECFRRKVTSLAGNCLENISERFCLNGLNPPSKFPEIAISDGFFEGYDVDQDAEGNIYAIGGFNAGMRLPNNIQLSQYYSENYYRGIVIMKFNDCGEMLWHVVGVGDFFDDIGNNSDKVNNGAHLSVSDAGEVYFSASIEHEIYLEDIFGNSIAIDNTADLNGMNVFAAKISTNGRLLTSSRVSDNGSPRSVHDIDVSPDGKSVYVSSGGSGGDYVNKLSEGLNVVWEKDIYVGGFQEPQGLFIECFGNEGVLISGGSLVGAALNGVPISNFTEGAFIFRLDNLGNIIWSMGYNVVSPLNSSGRGDVYKTVYEDEQNIYLGGSFINAAFFDSGITPIYSNGVSPFVAKINSVNGAAIWAVKVNSNNSVLSDITVVGNQPIVSFFKQGFGVNNASLFSQFDSQGNMLRQVNESNGQNIFTNSISAKQVGLFQESVVFTGSFLGQDLTLGNKTISSFSTQRDMFVSQLNFNENNFLIGSNTPVITKEGIVLTEGNPHKNISDFGVKGFPIPTKDVVYLETEGIDVFRYEIYNAFGIKMLQGKSEIKKVKIDFVNYVKGVYFAKVLSESGDFKIVRIILE
jgi:hypothetical protein